MQNQKCTKKEYSNMVIYDMGYDGKIQILGPVIIQTDNRTKLIEDIAYNSDGN